MFDSIQKVLKALQIPDALHAKLLFVSENVPFEIETAGNFFSAHWIGQSHAHRLDVLIRV